MRTDLTVERTHLLESIAARGVTDHAVLTAMAEVPREAFVSGDPALAYRDSAMPIEEGQTISQPYIVALTAQALELTPKDRVLEIGTGSGYGAAVLARVAAKVYTVERSGGLATAARERLADLGVHNVVVHHGDGRDGWDEYAPYDAIAVTAAAPMVPRRLIYQLAVHGRLVIPVGAASQIHELVRLRRTGHEEFTYDTLDRVRFVPLIPGRTG